MLKLRELIQGTILGGIVTIVTVLNAPVFAGEILYLNPSVNIRQGPSTSEPTIRTTDSSSEPAKELDKKQTEGHTWYKVRLVNNSQVIGWVRDDVVRVVPCSRKEGTCD